MSYASGVGRLVLGSRDVPASADFYSRVIGAQRRHDGEKGQLMLPAGFALDLVPARQPGPRHVVVAVPDLARARDALTRLGVAVTFAGSELLITDRRVASGQLVAATAVPGRAEPHRKVDGGIAGVTAFDHVCFVVPDLPLAVAAVRSLGGWPVLAGQTVFGARGVQVRFPRLKIELLTPTAENPISQFLAGRQGAAGLQHMTFLVRDVALAVRRLGDLDIKVARTDTSSGGWQETFIRPAQTDSFLVQLACTPHRHDHALPEAVLERALKGQFVMSDNVMRPDRKLRLDSFYQTVVW